jgi:hypothetical protein
MLSCSPRGLRAAGTFFLLTLFLPAAASPLWAQAAGNCGCLDPFPDGLYAFEASLRWAGAVDLKECVFSDQDDLALFFGDSFSLPDGRCERRAQAGLKDFGPDPASSCQRSIGFSTTPAALSIISDAGGCFPASSLLDIPLLRINTPTGTLVTDQPLELSARIGSAELRGARLSKQAAPIALYDPAQPGSPPAAFLLEFNITFASCSCFPPPRPVGRRARFSGTASLKLYGIPGDIQLDLAGGALLSRAGAAPFRDGLLLRCGDILALDGVDLSGAHPVVGEVRFDAPQGLAGSLAADLVSCSPAGGSLAGTLNVTLTRFAQTLVLERGGLEVQLEAAEPLRARATLSAVPAPLALAGDVSKSAVAELRSLNLSLDEDAGPPCLPPEGEEDFAAVARMEITLGNGPPEPWLFDGLLRIGHGPPDPPGGVAGAGFTPRKLLLTGYNTARTGAPEPLDLSIADGSEPAGNLSLVDPSRCDSLDFTLSFTPRLTGPTTTLLAAEPLEISARLAGPPKVGDRFTALHPVALATEGGGSISSFNLELVAPVRARAQTEERPPDTGSLLERVELPLQLSFPGAEMEVELDLLYPDLGDLTVELVGPPPAGDRVTLLSSIEKRVPPASRLRARFRDGGRPLLWPFNRGETVAPAAGSLAGLGLQQGVWALELRSGSPGALEGVVLEFRPEILPRGARGLAAKPLPGLAALPVACTSLVSWEDRAGVGGLSFLRDGQPLSFVLPPEALQFIDPSTPITPGRHQYLAVNPDTTALLGQVEVVLPPVPPVEGVTAEESQELLNLRWSNPVPYSAVRVDAGDGSVFLDGSPSTFRMPAADGRGKLLSLTGIRCGQESEPRFRPLAPAQGLQQLSCRLVGRQAQVEIEGVGPYSSLSVLRDGKPLAVLAGSRREFVDDSPLSITPGKELEYCVEPGYESGLPGDRVCCAIHFPDELHLTCAVRNPQDRVVVEVGVEGTPGDFDRIQVIREDLKIFEIEKPSYLVRDDAPPSYLSARGVSYFLASQYQGFVYPTARCLAMAPLPSFIRGDCNGDRQVDLSDALKLLWVLFGGDGEACSAACDFDGSRSLDITDAVYLLRYLFLSGQEPVPPYPGCAASQTPSAELDCKQSCN